MPVRQVIGYLPGLDFADAEVQAADPVTSLVAGDWPSTNPLKNTPNGEVAP